MEAQNSQNTQHTEYRKCSRCKKAQTISNFGFKKNGFEFRTCFRCRKIPEITNQPIISSQSSSEDKDVQIIEEEIQKHDDVSNLIKNIDEKTNIIFVINESAEILSRYGYKLVEFEYSLLTKFTYATETNPENAFEFIEWFDRNRLASIFETPYGAGLLVCPDAKTLFLLKVTNIEIIENYVISMRLKNKKRCQLCYEKSSNKFKECGQCSKQFCRSRFKKANEIGHRVPFVDILY